jgi:hypothetical protein
MVGVGLPFDFAFRVLPGGRVFPVIRSPTNGFVLAGIAGSQFRIPGVPLVSKAVLDTSDSPMLRVIDT